MIPLGGRGVETRGYAGLYNVHLDHPNIWETARARTLKLKTPLDMVKYSLQVHFLQLGASRGRRTFKTIARFG